MLRGLCVGHPERDRAFAVLPRLGSCDVDATVEGGGIEEAGVGRAGGVEGARCVVGLGVAGTDADERDEAVVVEAAVAGIAFEITTLEEAGKRGCRYCRGDGGDGQ